ncbi:hypothetical protein CesoFtcFv8_000204 [Champsocephalus esox]|uniref:Uncharacterized protein n=1 Tax=Champsocephalus esox TaxID=159716 RepID=A0AAN8DZP8_9TELE|nr:hypothetical protein CesoFtcFv8_000204 [Champsocephalus esox]
MRPYVHLPSFYLPPPPSTNTPLYSSPAHVRLPPSIHTFTMTPTQTMSSSRPYAPPPQNTIHAGSPQHDRRHRFTPRTYANHTPRLSLTTPSAGCVTSATAMAPPTT